MGFANVLTAREVTLSVRDMTVVTALAALLVRWLGTGWKLRTVGDGGNQDRIQLLLK
jgi:hypothetical protein